MEKKNKYGRGILTQGLDITKEKCYAECKQDFK